MDGLMLMSKDAGHPPCLKMGITWAQISDCPTRTSAVCRAALPSQGAITRRLYLLLLETESGEGEGQSLGSPGVGWCWCREGAHLQLLDPKCGYKMTALA